MKSTFIVKWINAYNIIKSSLSDQRKLALPINASNNNIKDLRWHTVEIHINDILVKGLEDFQHICS